MVTGGLEGGLAPSVSAEKKVGICCPGDENQCSGLL